MPTNNREWRRTRLERRIYIQPNGKYSVCDQSHRHRGQEVLKVCSTLAAEFCLEMTINYPPLVLKESGVGALKHQALKLTGDR